MAQIILLPNDCQSRARYLADGPLPDFYMSDFTVLGLLVQNYQMAVQMLTEEGYPLKSHNGGTLITIGQPSEIPSIRSFLAGHGINAELSDIADTIYQA